jgi:ring-1,2-phenylacetyl-CoA epoxidase subunit PaaE
LLKRIAMKFYSLTVSKIERFNADSLAISLTIPDALRSIFCFEPGQYITFSHSVEGEEIRRSYSIASTPSDEIITVGVKEVANGMFSSYANRALKEGDVLKVAAPEGGFVLDKQAGSILAIGAGSGITPLLSIIKVALSDNPDVKVGLIYGNQSARSMMFKNSIEELSENFGNRFFATHAFSREQGGDYFGRIDRGVILHALKNSLAGIGMPDKAYLCGPEAMIHLAKDTLLDQGVAAEHILFELFVASEDAKEINVKGLASVSVLLDGENHEIQVPKEELLLDSLLEQGIDAPYSCQGGSCSSCICKVTEGSVEMVRNQVLTDHEIASGFVLSCQAKITSKAIAVDFDNV